MSQRVQSYAHLHHSNTGDDYTPEYMAVNCYFETVNGSACALISSTDYLIAVSLNLIIDDYSLHPDTYIQYTKIIGSESLFDNDIGAIGIAREQYTGSTNYKRFRLKILFNHSVDIGDVIIFAAVVRNYSLSYAKS